MFCTRKMYSSVKNVSYGAQRHLGARDVELLDELAAVRVHARLRGPELVLDARLPRARLGNPAERYAGSKKWRMHSTYCT